MTGAAVLAASAAMSSGAGLVTLAVPRSQHPLVASQLLEVLTHPLSETEKATLHPRAVGEIEDLVQAGSCDVLVLGPGLSSYPATRVAILEILERVDIPTVVDADALNALATQKGFLQKKIFSGRRAPAVLTPHPGEMSRLMELCGSRVQENRSGSAQALSRDLGVVCVLKGYRTVITDGSKIFLNTTGNPGLAKGGTGDVLAGMLGALWAQVCIPSRYTLETALNASCLAVYLHGLCADLALRETTEQTLLASDLLRYLPQAFRKLKS